MDIEKLIEQYRQAADKWGKRHPVTDTFDLRVQDALRDAATALSTLQAANEKLWAELEEVKQERDEAVQCIRGITKSGRVWMCPYCVHAKDTTGGIAECELDVGVCMMPYSKFEWGGQKEDLHETVDRVHEIPWRYAPCNEQQQPIQRY